MLRLTILTSVAALTKEFGRCCRAYNSVHIASAWCGDPRYVLPYAHLEDFAGKITATIGRSFNHTHPDAIDLLLDLSADLRVFRDETELFHPKLYLFSSGGKIALFVGSSNFTYGGFNCNIEANVLLEGSPSAADNVQISALRKQLAEWHSDRCSFVPSTNWLVAYRTVYRASLKAEQKHRIQTPRQWETEIGSASWIRNADWHTYYGKVVDGLRQLERKREGYIEVLTAASRQLPRPWKRTYFDDPECRRIIGGFGEYGWLGHVGASGHFRAMLAGGSVKQQDTIVAVINSVGSLSAPVDWTYLDRQLHKLTKLGPTMKVWSRLLCLVRPDLFCTVASIPVRQNLAKTLGIPQNRFEHPDGYIQLLKLLHASPWFQSTKPMIKEELEIWRRRAAFMDAIFYP